MFETNKCKPELIIPLFDGREIIYNTLWATTGEQKVITVEALRVTTSQATNHPTCKNCFTQSHIVETSR